MKFANVAGRATLVIDGRAVDIDQATDGRIGSDPMVYSDLAVHPDLAAVAASVDPAAWPQLDMATLGAPVPRPPKGFGVALNYRSHAIESNKDFPTEPHFFGKTENCVCGPFDEIVVPAGRDMIDYEAEMVIVFGRTCSKATEAEAWSYLAGVTGGQDISDRGEQFRPPVKQFTIAKTYDTFGPTGPFLVTPDDLRDRDGVGVQGRIDGEVVQDGNTDDLIFSVPALVAWLSRFITFRPGDLVWTGTPGGVGEARTPQLFLRNGMVLETEVEGVGTMRNPVVER